MSADEGGILAPFRRVFVTDEHALSDVVPVLMSTDVIGVDVEMGQRVRRQPGGYQEWVHVLALIQLAADDLSVVVDPLRCPVAPLGPLMAGPARKVFLGGGQDAALLERAGIAPVGVVDVGEVALALFGRREDGMAALSRRIFGVSLDKTVRRADWMVRPLNPTLLAYAHRDAELTLQIYRWMEREHGDVLRFHQRAHFEGSLGPGAPEWLKKAVSHSQADALAIVMEHGIDAKTDGARLGRDLQAELDRRPPPRLLNRLLRVGADLGLTDILPFALSLTDSPSSLIRASAARAIGVLAEREVGEPILEGLSADPIEDVRKAAMAGLRDLRAAPAEDVGTDETVDEAPSLDEAAISALEQLKTRLERGAE